MSRTVRAEEAGAQVWEFVYEILTDPVRLVYVFEKMLESEGQPSAGEDEASWLRRISEVDGKQEQLLNLHLDGDITKVQFRAKSAELEEARATVESKLKLPTPGLHVSKRSSGIRTPSSRTTLHSCHRVWPSFPQKVGIESTR